MFHVSFFKTVFRCPLALGVFSQITFFNNKNQNEPSSFVQSNLRELIMARKNGYFLG
jgi:hypothetical protein